MQATRVMNQNLHSVNQFFTTWCRLFFNSFFARTSMGQSPLLWPLACIMHAVTLTGWPLAARDSLNQPAVKLSGTCKLLGCPLQMYLLLPSGFLRVYFSGFLSVARAFPIPTTWIKEVTRRKNVSAFFLAHAHLD